MEQPNLGVVEHPTLGLKEHPTLGLKEHPTLGVVEHPTLLEAGTSHEGGAEPRRVACSHS